MLATAGIVTIAFGAAAVAARRIAASPLACLLGAAFGSWADASRNGPELNRI